VSVRHRTHPGTPFANKLVMAHYSTALQGHQPLDSGAASLLFGSHSRQVTLVVQGEGLAPHLRGRIILTIRLPSRQGLGALTVEAGKPAAKFVAAAARRPLPVLMKPR